MELVGRIIFQALVRGAGGVRRIVSNGLRSRQIFQKAPEWCEDTDSTLSCSGPLCFQPCSDGIMGLGPGKGGTTSITQETHEQQRWRFKTNAALIQFTTEATKGSCSVHLYQGMTTKIQS